MIAPNSEETDVRLVSCLAAALLLAGCASSPMTASGPDVLPSRVPAAIEGQLQQIGRVIDPPKTAALYAPLQQHEPYTGVRVERGERFGPDNQRNLLDVFTTTPVPKQPRPVLVYVHGGGFTAGARRSGDSPFYDNIMLWAVKNGMVGVNTTYRLAPANPWPAAQLDLAGTLNWVREHIATYGGDPERIWIMGHSAGAAHVAQYLGHPEFHVFPGGGVAGAILLSGLYAPEPGTSQAVQAYFGSDPAVYAKRSALPGMAASGVPMLITYAELDPPEFPREAEKARAALCGVKHCPTLLRLNGHSHMSEVYAINTPDTALTDAIRAFVFRH
jgi:triacylglycerol lipase